MVRAGANQLRSPEDTGVRLPVSTSEASREIFGVPALSFLRHEQIYRPVRSVSGKRAQQYSTVPAPSHRLDESAAGYSLASCSPAELASASPADLIFVRLAEDVNHCVSCGVNESLCAGVMTDIVGNASRPHFPKNTDPGTGQDPYSVWMPATACSGRRVNMRSPGGTAARVIRQQCDGDTQSMIASPTKLHTVRFAALLGYWRNTGLSSKLLGRSEALADISDLSQDLGCCKVAGIRQTHQQRPIVELLDFRFDARGKNGDLFLQGRYNTRQREHEVSASLFFQLAGPTHRSCAQTSQKLGGRVTAAISPFPLRKAARRFSPRCAALLRVGNRCRKASAIAESI
jgi:hypothetical protein